MINSATEATVYRVLELTRTLPAAERLRLVKLLNRRPDDPLPEQISMDEAIELYLADACGIGRAAELAGVTRWDVMDRLKERGIPLMCPGEQTAAEMDALAEELRREGYL